MNKNLVYFLLIFGGMLFGIFISNIYFSSKVENTKNIVEKTYLETKKITNKDIKSICDNIKEGTSKDDFLSENINSKLSSSTFDSETYIIGDYAKESCSVTILKGKVYSKVYLINN